MVKKVSRKQQAANRRNAKKSTGPKTAEGKEAASQNAFKHGLFVKKAVVRDESQEEYDRHREALLAEWDPVGETETIVAERLVNLTWRLERAQRMQNQSIDYLGLEQLRGFADAEFRELYCKANKLKSTYHTGVPDDHMFLGRLAVNDWANYRVLDRMLMYERRIESSMYRAMRELKKLQEARKAEQSRAVREQSAQESPPARRHKSDLKKRSQLTPELMGTMPCAARDYGNQPPAAAAEIKANQSQLPGFGQDSKSQIPESEAVRMSGQ